MIGSLSGKVLELNRNLVLLDVHGVGYELICSARLLASLTEGQSLAVIVHSEVREDSQRLFGFADRLEKQVFLLLVQVKGVGARSALEIISRIDKRDLLRVIAAGDIGRLQAVKGIGRKTAERIVVELRDKVARLAAPAEDMLLTPENAVTGPEQDALAALVSLGFSRKEAEAALSRAHRDGASGLQDAGQMVKEALRFI